MDYDNLKLRWAKRRSEIRNLFKVKPRPTLQSVATRFGISRQRVHKIVNGTKK